MNHGERIGMGEVEISVEEECCSRRTAKYSKDWGLRFYCEGWMIEKVKRHESFRATDDQVTFPCGSVPIRASNY